MSVLPIDIEKPLAKSRIYRRIRPEIETEPDQPDRTVRDNVTGDRKRDRRAACVAQQPVQDADEIRGRVGQSSVKIEQQAAKTQAATGRLAQTR